MLKIVAFLFLISTSECLKKVNNSVEVNGRIIGGQEAFAGQFPWAAAIYITTNDGNYFCGGALLSSLYVLTAGQCVDG